MEQTGNVKQPCFTPLCLTYYKSNVTKEEGKNVDQAVGRNHRVTFTEVQKGRESVGDVF